MIPIAPPTMGPNTAAKKVRTATLDCSAVLGMTINGTCAFVRTTKSAVPIPIATTSLIPNFSFMMSYLLVPHKGMYRPRSFAGLSSAAIRISGRLPATGLSVVLLLPYYIRFLSILQWEINLRLERRTEQGFCSGRRDCSSQGDCSGQRACSGFRLL